MNHQLPDGARPTDTAQDDSESEVESIESVTDAFEVAGETLARSIVAALPVFVRTCVDRVGLQLDQVEFDQLARAVVRRTEEPLLALLRAPIDEQRSTPLTIVRQAVQEITEVVQHHGVIPVERDPFEQHALPDDLFGLAPGSWRDIGPGVEEPALRWGVIKAYLHRRLHAERPTPS